MSFKGYIQIYTGNGKGKTTAALGLALRAYGAGLKVFFAQFTKGLVCSEHKAVAKFAPGVRLKQFGKKSFITREPDADDLRLAKKGFDEIRKVVASGNYDLVILDEVTIANKYGLVSVDELLKLLKNRPEHVEIVLTGRNADPKLLKIADLVTEMKEIRHYYKKGVPARIGIEK